MLHYPSYDELLMITDDLEFSSSTWLALTCKKLYDLHWQRKMADLAIWKPLAVAQSTTLGYLVDWYIHYDSKGLFSPDPEPELHTLIASWLGPDFEVCRVIVWHSLGGKRGAWGRCSRRFVRQNS